MRASPFLAPCAALLVAAAVPAHPAAAHDREADRDIEGSSAVAPEASDLLVHRFAARPVRRTAQTDWDDAGILLRGERIRSGSKTFEGRGTEGWQRGYGVASGAWQDIGADLRIGAGLRLARTKSGTNGGPLLTRPTFALDQEAELTFGAQGGAHLAVSAFDRGGWGGESPDDAINRLVNGENPAARGLAISLADLPLGGGESAGGASLSMRVERFVTPIAPGAATSADLAMRMRF